jgi:hypothetical protein
LGEGHGVDEFLGEGFADGGWLALCGEHGSHSWRVVLVGYTSVTNAILAGHDQHG